MSYPAPPGPMPPRRSGSLGCLGVFSLFCLILFSVAEAGLLVRMNPAWFDRAAFWRGPIIEPDVVLVNQTTSGDETPTVAPPVAPLPRHPAAPIRFPFARAGADYAPSAGARVTLVDGAVVEFPPGSIREPTPVTVTPVISLPDAMEARLAGAVYELQIGQSQHYNFSRPIHVVLPYLPDAPRPVVAVWEGSNESGRWVALPSQVDAAAHTVSADVPHASILGTLWAAGETVAASVTGAHVAGIAAATAFFTLTGTGRSIAWSTLTLGSNTYTTNNFKIHYYSTGDDTVPTDAEYQPVRAAGMPSQASGGIPLYVQDLGAYLEQSRDELKAMGFPIAHAGFIHWDCFVSHMYELDKTDPGQPGQSNMGGPLFLSSRLNKMGEQNCTPDQMMRATCAHELTHVAQQDWVKSAVISGRLYKAYLEASAVYCGDLVWDRRGNPTNLSTHFYLHDGNGKLPSRYWYNTSDPEWYAYSSFFHFLDQRYFNAGLTFVQSAAEAKDLSPAGLDATVQRLPAFNTGGRKLADLFTEYAQDYYHDDFWHGDLYPAVHRGPLLHAIEDHCAPVPTGSDYAAFTRVALGTNATAHQQEVHPFAVGVVGSVPPLTAHAAHFWIAPLSKQRKAKLVITVQPNGSRSAAFRVYVARDNLAGVIASAGGLPKLTLPAGGSPAPFEEVEFDAATGRWRAVIEDVGKPDGANLVTVLAVNRSYVQDLPGFTIRRELLINLPYVRAHQADPPGSGKWTVLWPPSELKTMGPAGSAAFLGYNVYRRKQSEPDSAFQLVKEKIYDEQYVDQAGDGGAYVYTVRVVDQSGVESANAPPSGDDFIGTWDGELQLVDGELVGPLIAAVEEGAAKSDQQELAKIAAIKDPAERARRQQDREQTNAVASQVWKPIKELATTFELAARIGLPIEFDITEVDGKYRLTPRKLLYQDLKNSDSLDLEIAGPTTLKLAAPSDKFPPLLLRLYRADPETGVYEIREDEYKFKLEDQGKKLQATWKWVFNKKAAAN